MTALQHHLLQRPRKPWRKPWPLLRSVSFAQDSTRWRLHRLRLRAASRQGRRERFPAWDSLAGRGGADVNHRDIGRQATPFILAIQTKRMDLAWDFGRHELEEFQMLGDRNEGVVRDKVRLMLKSAWPTPDVDCKAMESLCCRWCCRLPILPGSGWHLCPRSGNSAWSSGGRAGAKTTFLPTVAANTCWAQIADMLRKAGASDWATASNAECSHECMVC